VLLPHSVRVIVLGTVTCVPLTWRAALTSRSAWWASPSLLRPWHVPFDGLAWVPVTPSVPWDRSSSADPLECVHL
jgi:hypothetical protein